MTFDPRVGVYPGVCPHCGTVLNAATCADDVPAVRPKPGDISICYSCHGVMEFIGTAGRLRKVERSELSPEEQAMVDRLIQDRKDAAS